MRGFLTALAAFAAAAVRPRTPLQRAIVPVLLVKLCLVVAARVFVFDETVRMEVPPAVMLDRLTGSTAAPAESPAGPGAASQED